MDYNKTINLPKTDFSMKAGLLTKEPQMLDRWDKEDLQGKIVAANANKPKYVLHDGPPYANNDIHLGTALNKVLKDMVVRFKNMNGYCSPYTPGWDTHGLPIELKALEKAGSKKNDITKLELRKLCREFAMKYVEIQKQQFKRLGVLGDFDNPYLTLKPEFEAEQVKIFGAMAKKGYIYKGLKAVYWCPKDKTALAEAEIEYSEDKCNSIYVAFDVVKDGGIFAKKGIDPAKTRFVIWTTTTWTLPGNVAICLGKDFVYAAVKYGDDYLIIAQDLLETVMPILGCEKYEIAATFKGSELEKIETKHPFLERNSLVILGEHVTLESGTGCVHTAPGHGVEDFEVCTKNYKELPIIVPVDASGILTEQAGIFCGISTKIANDKIAQHIKETGHLLASQEITHQYPHCWRCSTPILFRATEQWFCSVEDFKEETANAIEEVTWTPAWGKGRMLSMVKDRNDWCISRQRTWGVPIPAFYCTKCGEFHITDECINAVSKLFAQYGSDAWYEKSAAEIMPEGTKCKACGSTEFEKETDIMDVWFDSGTTYSILNETPCELYLEGADQFRGWFQSSLLTSVATKGKAPYKNVLCHGWVVDGDGRKMSKSLGNGILAQDIVKEYGADILRLWVASSDYQVDIRISKEILKQLSEAYRKIRNTSRFILGSLEGFDPNKDCVKTEDFTQLDLFILSKYEQLAKNCVEAYEAFDFHVVYHTVHSFCVVMLSNFYLDIIKDRLYCTAKDGVSAKAAKTAIYYMLTGLTKLLAPILAFTTEEIWSFIPKTASMNDEIAMETMPQTKVFTQSDEFLSKWARIIEIRDIVKKELEIKRSEKVIGSSLEAAVDLRLSKENYALLKNEEQELAEIFIVSSVRVLQVLGETSVVVTRADGEKCERCWKYTEENIIDDEGKGVCKRCHDVLVETSQI